MFPAFYLRMIISAIFAFALFWGMDRQDEKGRGYGGTIDPTLLPFCMLAFFILLMYLTGFKNSVEKTANIYFGVFLHMGFYYILLLSFLPLLRKHLRAGTVTAFWLMPNFLYYVTITGYQYERPLFAIKLSGSWVKYVPWVWASIFAVILIFKTAEHLVFRKKLLKDSYEASDSHLLSIWESSQAEVGTKQKKIPLYLSEKVASPVSVGLIKKKIFVVLPLKTYTDEELRLIFRHELIHIVRNDGSMKFFIMFCSAACWFNPFMWWSMKKCSEDIELNCDEMALRFEDDAVRKKYAELILSSAGEEKGFTSCLSSTAESLRFRLKNIVAPKEKSSGLILSSFVFFFLLLSYGVVSFAFEVPEADIFPKNSHIENLRIYNRNNSDMGKVSKYEVKKEKELLNYLESLRLYKYAGIYEYGDADIYYDFNVMDEKGKITYISLSEGHISANIYDEDIKSSEDYIFFEDLDDSFITSLLEEKETEQKKISSPDLNLYFYNEGVILDDEPMWPGKEIVSIKRGNSTGQLPPHQDISPCAIENFPVDEVELRFSDEPNSYAVYIYPLDESKKEPIREYKSTDLKDNRLPVKEDSRCVADVSFSLPDEGLVYRIKYYFNIILPKE